MRALREQKYVFRCRFHLVDLVPKTELECLFDFLLTYFRMKLIDL